MAIRPKKGPSLTPIPNGFWQLNHDFIWSDSVKVPAGFITDLDSVPRIPWFHAWLKGRSRAGALVHDYLYRQKNNRKQADKTFLEIMEWEQVKNRYRTPIFWGVRLFGWAWYYKIFKFGVKS